MLTFLILAVIFIFLTDGAALVKKKQWRELSTLGLLIGIAIFLVIANRFEIPTPVDGLQTLFRPVGEVIFEPHDYRYN